MKTLPTSIVVALGGIGLLLICFLIQSSNPTASLCLEVGIRELSGSLPTRLAQFVPIAYLPLLPVIILSGLISFAVTDRERALSAYLAAILAAGLLFRSPIDIFVATIAFTLILLRRSWLSIIPASLALFIDRAPLAPIAILALGIVTCKDRKQGAGLFTILLGYAFIAVVLDPQASLIYGTTLSDSFLGFTSPNFHGRIGAAAVIVTAIILAYLRNNLQVSALLAVSAMLYLWGEQYSGFLAATFIFATFPATPATRFGVRQEVIGLVAVALTSIVIVREPIRTNELDLLDTPNPVFVGVSDFCVAKRAGLTPVSHLAFGSYGRTVPSPEYATILHGGAPALEVLNAREIDAVITSSETALFQTLRLAPEWETTKEGVKGSRSHFGAMRSVQKTLFERKNTLTPP